MNRKFNGDEWWSLSHLINANENEIIATKKTKHDNDIKFIEIRRLKYELSGGYAYGISRFSTNIGDFSIIQFANHTNFKKDIQWNY